MSKTNNKNEQVYGVHIRVSTDMQAEHGDSIEAQKNLAKELIEKNGGVLYKFYIEEGISASKTRLKDRPVLLECLRDIEDGIINNLITYRRDRLVRKTEESLVIRNILEKNNCQIHFTATGEQDMELNDPYSKLIENVRSSLDEIESIQTAIRVSDIMFDKAKRGEFSGGNVPYGYEVKDGYLVPIESEIPIIQEVVDMYLEGYGKHSIVKWLEGKEVKNKGKRHAKAKKLKQHKRSSERWTLDTVDTILFNLTYSGQLKYTKRLNGANETVIVDSPYIKPIRTKETQERINKEREKRKNKISPPRRYTTSFLLTGILICSECGREYASRTVTKKNGQIYRYYACKGRTSNDSYICNSKSFKKEILEEFILEEAKKYIDQFLNEDMYIKVKKEISKRDEKLKEKLDEVRQNLKQKEKDFQALSRLLLDLNTEDEMYDMMKDMYQKQQKEILSQIKNLKESETKISEELDIQTDQKIDIDDIVKQLKDFENIIEFAPTHLQKQFLETLFSKIEIDKEGNVDFYLTFEVDKKKARVDFCSIGNIKSTEDNSIMFYGGVGDTTSIKNITLLLNEGRRSMNFFEWLSTLVNFISDTFYEFFISKNDKMKSPKYFNEKTNISIYMHKEYRLYKRIPTYERCKIILEASGSSIEEYVEFVKSHSIPCNKNIFKEITNDNNIIRRSMKRLKEVY